MSVPWEKKRPIFVILFACCLLLCFPFFLHAQTKIKVGLYQNVPLSFSDPNGTVKGFVIDILEHVAKKEGWTIEYHIDTWSQCIQNLEDGEIDLLGGIAITPERAQNFDYTYESVQTEWGQVYSHKKYGAESILDLKFKKIAVLQGDVHFINLRQMMSSFGFAVRFIEAFEYETVMELVEVGRCDVGVVSYLYGLQHENDYQVFKSPIIFNPQKLYFAVRNGENWWVLQALDRYLHEMKTDKGSAYYKALQKWFVTGDRWAFPTWLVWVLAGFSGLLVIFLFTSVILGNRVKARTTELTEKNIELLKVIEERKKAEIERFKLETQLQRAQKMEAIGTLAGGVAHDLNNILSGLVSYPELLLMEIPEDSPLRQPIMTIKKSGENAANVVNDLLTLARRGVAVTEVLNLNNAIADYLDSPEFEKLKLDHNGIQVETHLDENLLNIAGSPVHLTKTVMNLVSNAVEAMPRGGKVVIKTENRYIDRPIRGYDTIEEGDYVVFGISDSGVGISSEDIDRIFEPFYTKKVMGRSGTGLGMAVVWGTVKDHNGYIDVRSTENRGTSFTIYFPVTRQRRPEDTVPFSIEKFKGKGESILIVDDIQEQREIASKMLTRLEYKVAVVPSGEEAIWFLEKNHADLIVLDMIMDPGMDGLDTYIRALEINPGQKAIIASGFSETDRVRKAQSLGAGAYVRKPYTLEKLGLAVKEELDKTSAEKSTI
jgi:signal transduction histidine kinase/ActR/RegA family two-component response regulator